METSARISTGPAHFSRVALLHPIGLDGECWQWVDAGQSMPRHVFPGHGSRPPLTGEFSLLDLADDLADQLTDEHADIVGISLGGAVALQFALRYPARVKSLVVACATAVEDEAVLNRRADAELASAQATEATIQRWFTPEALELDGPPVAYARRRLTANDHAAVAATWRALARHDVIDKLQAIRAPTTLVAGVSDQSVSLSEVQEINLRIPTSRLVTIDGPHMLILENPSEFADVIVEHLRWVGSL